MEGLTFFLQLFYVPWFLVEHVSHDVAMPNTDVSVKLRLEVMVVFLRLYPGSFLLSEKVATFRR